MDRDTIAFRLAAILTKLLDGQSVGVAELADEFGVNERTIYRDLKERLRYLPLRKVGERFELESYAVATRGASIEKIKEFAALCGLSMLFPKLDFQTIIDVLNPQTNIAFRVTPQVAEDLSKKRGAFDAIAAAILRSERVRCDYKGKRRVLEPYKLISQSGVWYVLAAEKGGEKLKSLALGKVENPVILGESFSKNAEFEAEAQSAKTAFVGEKIEVILEIKPEAKEYFLRKKLFEFERLESGGENLRIKCEFSFEDEALNIVKAWIPFIKIISPESLEQRLKTTLKAYLEE